mgnify:CR=1 FL=1
MSRSYRRTPIFGNAKAASEKDDKRAAHQKRRCHFRTALGSTQDPEAFQFHEANKAHSNLWDHAKDGKCYSPVRVRHVGRAMVPLAAPRWLKGERAVHKAMGK